MEENNVANNGIDLAKLTDKQKMLLSQLGYLNINEAGIEKIKNDGLTIRQLSEYLDVNYANKPYNGQNKNIGDKLAGEGTITTEIELLQELVNEGLGDIKITDIVSNVNGKDSVLDGLNAMAFEDGSGNKGISYSGSDFDKDWFADWIAHDAGEWLTGNSPQVESAKKFFDDNKDINGNNYIYGHSLGGNLTAHTYVDNYNEIAEAFSINGTPLNTEKLSEEQIAALNSDKYSCYVVGGDPVSQAKDYSEYQNNVKYIKNNGEVLNAELYAHTVQAATYKEDGSFDLAETKEIEYEWQPDTVLNALRWVNNQRGNIENIATDVTDKFTEISNKIKESTSNEPIQNYSEEIDSKKPNYFKRIWEKVTNFVKDLFAREKEEIKLLPSGQEREPISANNMDQRDNRNSFVQSMQLRDWISATYTKEQAEKAQEISNNPKEIINKIEAEKTKNQNTRDPRNSGTVQEM